MLLTTSYLCFKNDRQPSVNRASTERQPNVNRASTERQPSINRVSTERHPSVNGASTIFDLASWIIQGQWDAAYPQSTYRQPFVAKILAKISRPPPTIERTWSVNNLCGGSVSYTAMKCIALFLNWVLHSQSFQYVLVYNFTNMHAMSHRSDFLLVALESIFKNQQSAVLWLYFRQSLESYYQAFLFLPPCLINNLQILQCQRLWSLPKWTCLYSGLERLYFTNSLRRLVGFNECRLEPTNCLE